MKSYLAIIIFFYKITIFFWQNLVEGITYTKEIWHFIQQ